MKIRNDLKLHLLGSALISFFVRAFGGKKGSGATTAIAVGAAKEVADSQTGGTAAIDDLAADAAGGVAGEIAYNEADRPLVESDRDKERKRQVEESRWN